MKPTAGIDRASSNLRMTSHAVAPPRRESRATTERICGEVRIGGPGRQHYAGDTFGAARSQGWRRGCIEKMAASQVTGPGSGRLTEPLRGANGHTKPNLPSRRVLLGAWDSTLVWRFPPEGAAAGEFRDARDWIAIEPRLCRCFQEASSARFRTPGTRNPCVTLANPTTAHDERVGPGSAAWNERSKLRPIPRGWWIASPASNPTDARTLGSSSF